MDATPRKPYPSDLTDAQWALLEPMLPPPIPAGAPRKTDFRDVLDAIFYLLTTGCAWSALPHDFPPEGTVRYYFHRWRRSGLWEHIHGTLRSLVRQQAGKEPQPSAGSIDSQTVKATPLRGRVVDSQGKPVAGARVASNETFQDGNLEWSAVTDDQGRFEWPDAQTSGSIVLDANKSGFEQALARQFEAGNREITLTMHRPLHLHGTVTDADTGQPVDHFDLIPGWGPYSPGGRVEWLRGPSVQQLGNGRYDFRGGLFPDQGFNRSIRIEA